MKDILKNYTPPTDEELIESCKKIGRSMQAESARWCEAGQEVEALAAKFADHLEKLDHAIGARHVAEILRLFEIHNGSECDCDDRIEYCPACSAGHALDYICREISYQVEEIEDIT